MINSRDFAQWRQANQGRILKTLVDYVNIDTTTPKEADAFGFLGRYVSGLGMTSQVLPFPADLASHPAYTHHAKAQNPARAANFRCTLATSGAKGKVLFNSHVDVVPADGAFPEAFDAQVRDGFVIGRGACDTKQNLIMAAEAIRFLQDSGIALSKSVGIDVVAEEEIGGNGTLGAIVSGLDADEVVVLEGTELNVFCGHRGCLTFEIVVTGKAVHMGAYASGVSAIDCAIRIIGQLKKLQEQMTAESRKDPYFEIYDCCTPVNIGLISGGQWPGSVAASCTFTGNIGFLPRYSVAQVQRMLVESIAQLKDPWIDSHCEIRFPGLKNEAYLTDRGAPVVTSLVAAGRACGLTQEKVYGWNVSCDGRLYGTLTKLPTVIFGCGKLQDKHSNTERISIDEMFTGMQVLANYLS